MLCPALLATAAGAEPQTWMKRDDFETQMASSCCIHFPMEPVLPLLIGTERAASSTPYVRAWPIS